MLNESELERYDRQIRIPGWGKEGQKKLKNGKVVLAGIGGLGCPTSLYLAAAGVGRITLIDNERFELNNLNRQILSSYADIGRLKTEVAKEKLEALNSEIEIISKPVKISEINVRRLIRNSDVVVDGMDNWKTRLIINEGCVQENIPFIHAGIYGWNGQITTIFPKKGPCLRCLLPKTPIEVTPFPVLGAIPGFFSMLQVMEVIKLFTCIGEPLIGKLLIFNGESTTLNIVNISRNKECAVCKQDDINVSRT